MRLIDADALNKRLSEMESEISEEDCMPGDAFSDGIISAILDIKKCIQNQEIVYDVNKVVDELEERKALHERLVEYENKNGTVTEKYQHIKAIDVLNDAIEIVKQSGVSNDVCEWESVSDGEFIQNPHTKRLYSNEPSMKNVYCNTCGKKIRIVGD